MFTETELASVTRAKDTLKTGLQILMDVIFSPSMTNSTSDNRNNLFEVEKKIQEALGHLNEIGK